MKLISKVVIYKKKNFMIIKLFIIGFLCLSFEGMLFSANCSNNWDLFDSSAEELIASPNVNINYAYAAVDIDYFLNGFQKEGVSVIPAIPRTRVADYFGFLKSFLEAEEQQRGTSQRLILIPYAKTGISWDALVVSKNQKGYKGYYLSSTNKIPQIEVDLINLVHSVYGQTTDIKELCGYYLVEPTFEDEGIIALANLKQLSIGYIGETAVISTLFFREQDIGEDLSKDLRLRGVNSFGFAQRQNLNLPVISYVLNGKINHVLMCLDRNFDEDQQTLLVLKKSLKLLKENVEECTEDLERAKTYFIEAFVALMGGTEEL